MIWAKILLDSYISNSSGMTLPLILFTIHSRVHKVAKIKVRILLTSAITLNLFQLPYSLSKKIKMALADN